MELDLKLPMFSKILIKLIDQAIVPAILLLVSRIVTMLAFARLLEIEFEVTRIGFLFSNHADYVIVNSYSIFAMTLLLASGILYILIKAYLFHETHIAPHLTAQLFSLRLSNFIQTSFDLYSQGAVWLSYVFFLFLITIFMSILGLVHNWAFFSVFALTVLSTVAFVFDIEQEMSEKDDHSEMMELEEYVLKFDGYEKN